MLRLISTLSSPFSRIRSPYQILGVRFPSSESQIKAAYHRKIKKYHPDASGSPSNSKWNKFHQIQIWAYQMLKENIKWEKNVKEHREGASQKHKDKSKYKKEKYNNSKKYREQQTDQQIEIDFNDLQMEEKEEILQEFMKREHFHQDQFEEFVSFFKDINHKNHQTDFQEQFQDQRQKKHKNNNFYESKSSKNLQIHKNIEISASEAKMGVQKSLFVKKRILCLSCHGNYRPVKIKCRRCKGAGMIMKGLDQIRNCPICHGEGTMKKHDCDECKGKGQIQVERQERIFINPGALDGSEIVFRGRGHQNIMKGFYGDLIVHMTIYSSTSFRRQGSDTFQDIYLSISDAILGHNAIPYNTVWGQRYLKVKPGTQEGTIIKKQGEGYKKNGGRSNGDHFLTLRIEIPSQIGQEEAKIFQMLKQLQKNPDLDRQT